MNENAIHGAPNRLRMENARAGLGNQFVGLRIRFDDGGCTKSARQSIREAPDLMVEDG